MPRTAGFTLIEALVAFAILALVFVMAMPLLRDTTGKVDHAANTRTAVSLAESKLAELNAGPVRRGDETGTAGGFRWRLTVAPTGELPPDNPLHLETYKVLATVAWTEGRAEQSVALETLRLGARP